MTIRLPALAIFIPFAALLAAEPAGRQDVAAGPGPAALPRPQDDLFAFVNAGWLERTDIPAERVVYDAFAELGEKVDEDVHAIVRDAIAMGDRAGADGRKIADLYLSVADEAAIEARGRAPLEPQLARITGIQTGRDLAKEIGHLSARAAGGAFEGTVVTDPVNPRRVVAQIAQGGTLLPERDYYFAETPRAVTVRERYLDYLSTIFRLLDHPDPAGAAASVFELERELARVQWSVQQSREPGRTPRRLTFLELERDFPGFDWWAWGEPQGLTTTRGVILLQPSFFKAFAALVPATPLETWRLWLTVRYVTYAAPYVSNAFGDARFEFFGRFLTGQQAPRPRWRRGVGMVNAYLGDAVGRLYVERHFPAASRRRAEALVSSVRIAFAGALEAAAWLEPETRRAALDKLSRLRTRIGYPDKWRGYGGLEVKRDDLLGNLQRAQQFEHRAQSVRAAGRQDPRHWPVTAQSVNAFYSAAGNEIVLPAAILQPPFFDPAGDDAGNYGAIGAIVGHELAHGFDLRGRRFDAYGAERDWWRTSDERAFVERAAALVTQFDAYAEHGVAVDGRRTLLENAADLAGLTVAHRAWRASLDGRAPAAVVDGYTGDQRFFMAWARAWRAKTRPEYARQASQTHPHAPARFRVNGPVSHMPAFYEAFGVQPGDRLYRDPAARIAIW